MDTPKDFRIFSPLTPRGAYLKTFLEKFNPIRIMREPPRRENYVIFFLDIIDSTRYFLFLEENFILVYQIYNYFWNSLENTLKIKIVLNAVPIIEYDFKLLGDGILIFIPLKEFNRVLDLINKREKFIENAQIKSITPETLIKEIYEKLNDRLNTPFKVRVLGGSGSLLKIPYGKDSYEYLGCSISYLVKKSKEVDTYKWFGEITREKCRELLNS